MNFKKNLNSSFIIHNSSLSKSFRINGLIYASLSKPLVVSTGLYFKYQKYLETVNDKSVLFSVHDKNAFRHRLNRFHEISQIFFDFQCLKSEKICEIS
ncbi:MAG: hypothetical protein RLZZ628_2525 [Bacteroidota bacterium]|jgi:hypothetical protein